MAQKKPKSGTRYSKAIKRISPHLQIQRQPQKHETKDIQINKKTHPNLRLRNVYPELQNSKQSGFERKVLRRILGPVNDVHGWIIRHNFELYQMPPLTQYIILQRLRWAGHVARTGEDRIDVYKRQL